MAPTPTPSTITVTIQGQAYALAPSQLPWSTATTTDGTFSYSVSYPLGSLYCLGDTTTDRTFAWSSLCGGIGGGSTYSGTPGYPVTYTVCVWAGNDPSQPAWC